MTGDPAAAGHTPCHLGRATVLFETLDSGFPKIKAPPFWGGPQNKHYSIWRSILGYSFAQGMCGMNCVPADFFGLSTLNDFGFCGCPAWLLQPQRSVVMGSSSKLDMVPCNLGEMTPVTE